MTDSASLPLRRGRPPKLTPAKLADAASQVGFADLKLAEVAEKLGVSMQTLYNHVSSRDELLYIAAVVLGEKFQLPEDHGQDWVDWSWELAQALKALYDLAPGLAGALVARSRANAPVRNGQWEPAQRIAERSGFHPVVALWANMAVHEFVFSWSAGEEKKETPTSPAAKTLLNEDDQKAPSFLLDAATKAARQLPVDLRFEMTIKALLQGFSALRGKAPEALVPSERQGAALTSRARRARG